MSLTRRRTGKPNSASTDLQSTAGGPMFAWPLVARMRTAASMVKGLIASGRHIPGTGCVKWGNLRRTKPMSRNFGYDLGGPVDRYYIETFLAQHQPDIAGRVIEVEDDSYMRRFGASKVTRSDVLDLDPGDPRATIVTDLNDAPELPSDTFDCIVLTQTLQYVYDLRAAVRDLHRSLRPGGVLLVTVPGITPIDQRLAFIWYWNFTPASLKRLLLEYFPNASVAVETFGNLLSMTAICYGLSHRELLKHELDERDPNYPVIVAGLAVRPRL